MNAHARSAFLTARAALAEVTKELAALEKVAKKTDDDDATEIANALLSLSGELAEMAEEMEEFRKAKP